MAPSVLQSVLQGQLELSTPRRFCRFRHLHLAFSDVARDDDHHRVQFMAQSQLRASYSDVSTHSIKMAGQQPEQKDYWSSNAYKAAADFVPKLTTTVLKYLDPQPGDRILDIGCGDGTLTLQIASALPLGQILGLDASPSMISAAQQRCPQPSHANCSFHVQDCTSFSNESRVKYLDGSWDKVFSNAALHWIFCRPETRGDVIRAVYSALKPGGTFVFEMGGFGNCGEVCAALLAALIADGLSPAEARQRSPWFFPSEEWMRNVLEEAGFEVVKIESEYRPTRLTASDDEGKGGLEGWVKLMAAQFLEAVRDKERAVQLVADILQSIITKQDGTQWIGYVRLRGVAKRGF